MNKKIIFVSLIFVILSVTLLLGAEKLQNELFGTKFQNELAKQIFNKCKYDSHCAIEYLQKVSQSHNKETVMGAVNELIFTYSESMPLCHQNSHHIGNFVYGYFGNVKDAIESINATDCGGSIIHSIIQNHMDSQVLLYNTDPTQVDFLSICPGSTEYPTIDRWECIHGVGHGLASIYGYNVSTAVSACQKYDDWEQISCAKGLFMENVVRFKELHDSDFNEDDLSYPCDILDDAIAAPCYHYQPTFVDYVLDDPEKTINYCKTVEEKFSEYCFRGIGRLYSFLAVSDIKKIDLLCNTKYIPYEKLTYCYQGVAMVFADNRSIPEALTVCQSIPEEFQNDCVGEVGKWIKLVNSDSVQQCQTLNSEKLVQTCMNSKIQGISIL